MASSSMLNAVGVVFLQSILLTLRFWFIPVLVPKQLLTNRKKAHGNGADTNLSEGLTQADRELKAHLTQLVNAATSPAPASTTTPPTRLLALRQKAFSGLAGAKKVVTSRLPSLPPKDELPEYMVSKRNSLRTTMVDSVKPKTSSKGSRAMYYSFTVTSQALHLYSFLSASAQLLDFMLSWALNVPDGITRQQALVAVLVAREYAMSDTVAPPPPAALAPAAVAAALTANVVHVAAPAAPVALDPAAVAAALTASVDHVATTPAVTTLPVTAPVTPVAQANRSSDSLPSLSPLDSPSTSPAAASFGSLSPGSAASSSTFDELKGEDDDVAPSSPSASFSSASSSASAAEEKAKAKEENKAAPTIDPTTFARLNGNSKPDLSNEEPVKSMTTNSSSASLASSTSKGSATKPLQRSGSSFTRAAAAAVAVVGKKGKNSRKNKKKNKKQTTTTAAE